MNWLSMMPDEDKRQIVKELASRLSAEPILASSFENAVEKVLTAQRLTKHKYSHPAIEMRIDKLEKFIFPRLTTADQPLIDLINTSKKLCASVEAIFDKSKKWEIIDLTTPVILAADAVAKLYNVKL